MKTVTFGKNKIINIENVSYYMDPMSLTNVLSFHCDSLRTLKKEYLYGRDKKLRDMARLSYLISNNNSILRVSINTKDEYDGDIFMKDLIEMLKCGFEENNTEFIVVNDNENSFCFTGEFINVKLDQNMECFEI